MSRHWNARGCCADAERALGLFFEPQWHAWLAARPTLLTLAGLFYVWVHLPATIGALVWARLERPHAFPLARNTFLATQVITVVGYLAWPVAPPRMAPELGFSDTLAAVYGTGGETLAHSVQSPYAAMPSGHVAFACVAAGTVFALVRSRALRAGAVGVRRTRRRGHRGYRQPLLARCRGRRAGRRARVADRQTSNGVHP